MGWSGGCGAILTWKRSALMVVAMLCCLLTGVAVGMSGYKPGYCAVMAALSIAGFCAVARMWRRL